MSEEIESLRSEIRELRALIEAISGGNTEGPAIGNRSPCLMCGNPADKARGLCVSCYGRYRDAIESGAVTESELINRGLLLAEKKKGGRPRKNPFTKLDELLLEKTVAAEKKKKG